MKRVLIFGLCAFGLAVVAAAQESKIEISPFAGGYLNSGYQESRIDLPGFAVNGSVVGQGAFAPSTGEPNSGIFGVRASHSLTKSLALEGTFGFSPAGPHQETGSFAFSSIGDFLSGTQGQSQFQSFPTDTVHTFHYAANILYEFYDRGGWAPFFTAGAGAVTRTKSRPPSIYPILSLEPNGTPAVFFDEPRLQTNPSLNLGGGVKKYLGERYGIRFDFRSYISQPSGDTVNNMELSFGLIFRL